MSKSILYAANTNTQAYVAAGTVVNFGNAVRRYGCNCDISGGNAEVDGVGYYNVTANITASSGGGTVVVNLLKDGVAIPGAVASITTAANDICAITIPAVVRQTCCCSATITAVISGVAGTVYNAGIVVEKL